ncbi:MAG TPA: hypothetical protein VE074_02375 [Jatrophihabitantaceae bacterium]|nr:hypothetical protein [Jatrophihabitantaceae bacterium]
MFAFRALVAAGLIVSLAACSSSKNSSDKEGDGLSAALALAPSNSSAVLYTDWSALGHQYKPQTPAFVGTLTSYDVLIRDDLGFGPADAQWEADATSPSGGPVTILQFDGKTDLGPVAGKLAALGYTKSDAGGRQILTGSISLAAATTHEWIVAMTVAGIDTARHLLVAGHDAATVQAILSGGASFGDRADAKAAVDALGSVASAAVSVGASACAQLASARLSPDVMAQAHEKFTALGTFSSFSALAVGVRDVAGTTGVAALTFPDAASARSNEKARSAAPPVMTDLLGTEPGAIKVDSSSVDGPVLRLSLQTTSPRVLAQAVTSRALGFDVCL